MCLLTKDSICELFSPTKSNPIGASLESQLPCDIYSNRIKDKNPMIISIDAKKAFDKPQHRFIIRICKLGIRWNYLNIINVYMNSPQLTQYLCFSTTESFSSKIWNKTCSVPLLLFKKLYCGNSIQSKNTRKINKRHLY